MSFRPRKSPSLFLTTTRTSISKTQSNESTMNLSKVLLFIRRSSGTNVHPDADRCWTWVVRSSENAPSPRLSMNSPLRLWASEGAEDGNGAAIDSTRISVLWAKILAHIHRRFIGPCYIPNRAMWNSVEERSFGRDP